MKNQSFSIWDNFARHAQELRDVGASDVEIEQLRNAAQLVHEAVNDTGDVAPINLAVVDEPITLSNGWKIAAPTKQARFLAREAVSQVTGGKVPETNFGVAIGVAAGLYVLKAVGEGNINEISAALSEHGGMVAIASKVLEELDANEASMNKLGAEYMRLMGFTVPASLARANQVIATYLQVLSRLQAGRLQPPRSSPAESSTAPTIS